MDDMFLVGVCRYLVVPTIIFYILLTPVVVGSLVVELVIRLAVKLVEKMSDK